MYICLYLFISYQNSPDLRLTWLYNMAAKHGEVCGKSNKLIPLRCLSFSFCHLSSRLKKVCIGDFSDQSLHFALLCYITIDFKHLIKVCDTESRQ